MSLEEIAAHYKEKKQNQPPLPGHQLAEILQLFIYFYKKTKNIYRRICS